MVGLQATMHNLKSMKSTDVLVCVPKEMQKRVEECDKMVCSLVCTQKIHTAVLIRSYQIATMVDMVSAYTSSVHNSGFKQLLN